jgi:hypothetical protein
MRKIMQGSLFLLVAFMISGCAASQQYLKPEDTSHTYNKPYQEVFDAVPAAVKSAKMVLIEVREADGVVDVVAPPSFWTSSLGNLMQGGDKVTVVVKKIDETQTSIQITSVSRGDLVDFGRSARVVSTLFKNLDEKLK